jgi:hypothetical protein
MIESGSILFCAFAVPAPAAGPGRLRGGAAGPLPPLLVEPAVGRRGGRAVPGSACVRSALIGGVITFLTDRCVQPEKRASNCSSAQTMPWDSMVPLPSVLERWFGHHQIRRGVGVTNRSCLFPLEEETGNGAGRTKLCWHMRLLSRSREAHSHKWRGAGVRGDRAVSCCLSVRVTVNTPSAVARA